MYTLENEYLKVSAAAAGAELKSVILKETGRECLWQADPAYWGRSAPVLFPLVGAYRDNTSFYEGKAYHMGQHGFARDSVFSLVSQTEDTLVFSMTENEATLEKYPFAFELIITYRLIGRSIEVVWTVKSREENRPIYFSIGAHPAFNCGMSGYRLGFESDRPLTVGILEKGVLTDRTKTLVPVDGTYPITPELFDEDALVLENGQVHEVRILDPEGGLVAAVKADAPVFGIWSPVGKKAPFVCLEPWYGRADRADFNQKIEEREWGNTLLPGETFEKSYLITF